MPEAALHVGSGKVRELYALDQDRLLLFASVMGSPSRNILVGFREKLARTSDSPLGCDNKRAVSQTTDFLKARRERQSTDRWQIKAGQHGVTPLPCRNISGTALTMRAPCVARSSMLIYERQPLSTIVYWANFGQEQRRSHLSH